MKAALIEAVKRNFTKSSQRARRKKVKREKGKAKSEERREDFTQGSPRTAKNAKKK